MKADQQKDAEVEYIFSLTTFDTQIDVPYLGKQIAEVDGDTLTNYGPRGSTALYDAVGKTLQTIDDNKTITFDKAIVVIVTDGQENSSREWSKDAVHSAIDERIKRGNWTFTYLGTQPETWDDATSLGVGVGASATYTPTNAAATYATMATASANMARSAFTQSASFLHDNTTPMMRCSVGMKTSTDADDAVPTGLGVPVGVGVTFGNVPASSIPQHPKSHKPNPPKKHSPVSKNKKWK